GTLARTWRDRGPTWSGVFQTVEGGLGYWAGNHFRYGPPKVQYERDASVLRLRDRFAGLVVLLQQRSFARQSIGYCPTEQPAVDSSRCIAVCGQSQRTVPGLFLDGLALYGSQHGRSAHGRPELDLFSERGQLQGADRLLYPGDLEQNRQTFQLSVPLWTRA